MLHNECTLHLAVYSPYALALVTNHTIDIRHSAVVLCLLLYVDEMHVHTLTHAYTNVIGPLSQCVTEIWHPDGSSRFCIGCGCEVFI